MKIMGCLLVLCAFLCGAAMVAAQTPVGTLAIDERQGDRYGWAVDYETAGAARSAALAECGPGCSVVLTFERCAAYAADQDADRTAVGWAESFTSADGARQAALAECGSRGGTGCIVRVWGCNGHVVEEGLGLDRAGRRRIQQGLEAAGFDPGGADGMFGPRTREAIRSWQSSQGTRSTGYLDGASVAALRSASVGQPPGLPGAAQPATAELEGLFWQSIMNSTNAADFEAYLSQFPNGVFRVLAQNRLSALGVSGGTAAASGDGIVGVDARPRPGAVFRPDRTCAGQPAGTACWMEIAQQPGCYVWDLGYAVGATVTWTGPCSDGLAQGTGSLTWVWDGNENVETGQLQDGKYDGHWVVRRPNGTVEEGPAVDGEQHGHWVVRRPNGQVEEGPYVDGERHGDWTVQWANGRTSIIRWVNGEQQR